MANRKVLINRHTSGNTAPVAADMYKGEIAVQHKTGEEILWTKNNDNVMVPFISCAQTISIIESKIQTSDTDVKVATGETHLEVSTGETPETANHFTLNTKDVQSEEEFEAYSAATKVRIDNNVSAITNLTSILSALTDVVVTGITGDAIITATEGPTPATTGSNTYTITHKTGHETNGFNKLSTDAYGHVTAATAVAASDIKALGFEDSAWTQEAINDAIDALDSAISASTTGKYLTAISIKNGMLDKIEEADIPTLEVESAGTGNVVASITVTDHKITYQTASVATSEDIAELSAATIALSAGTVHDLDELSGATQAISGYAHDEIAQLSGATQAISGYAHNEIAQLSGATESISGYAHNEIAQLSGATVAEFTSAFTAIQAMDKAADAEDGKVVTTVSEVDGVVSETKANVKDLQLGGYAKDTTATGDIASADTINAALSKLENKANAITIANADGSINVTTGATGTDINVNIKANDPILAKDGGNGVYSTLNLVKITTGLPATVKERYELQGIGGAKIGEDVDIAKDSHIVSINYISDPSDAHYQNLEYVYIDASGVTQTTYVDMSSLVIESEFKSGVTATNGIVHGVVDSTSESFLTVGGDGFKLSGVQDAINAAVEALDVTGDTAVAGQYVAAIEETNGVVAVKTRANVSEAVLNNYAKGSDATAVASTDTVNQAISKLENQVDAAKAAATTKVVEGTDAGNNMTITPSTSATDGSVTYTIDLADVASATALTAEIAARKAVDGQNGDTYAANTNANFISNATSLNDADVKLDAAIKALSGDVVDYVDDQIDEVYASGVSYTDAKVAAEIALLDSSTAVTAGKYITGIAIADGKISGITEESLPANVAISATTATPVDTASAVLTGVTASGVDNHELTFGMSNKVFSAETSNSALTSESALTADSAEKVANALSVSGYATSESSSLDSAFSYDGSAAQSLTFGTNGPAGLKSMSMTSAGVVDVEVIDCGEY